MGNRKSSSFKQRRQVAGFAALLLLVAVPVAAQQADTKSTIDDQTSVELTIYNVNLGLVKDVRSLSLSTGIQSLWFEDVAAQIDPTSVHIRSLDAPRSLQVLEQNFEYDLISPQKLLEKYIGRELELVFRAEDGAESVRAATLLGTEGGLVFEMDGKIAVNPGGRPLLPSLPEGLISRPSLVWLLENGRAEQTVEASYLTDGISWKANYVAILSKDDKETDLSGWVTIDNRSGATYRDAGLKLVAGDVQRITPQVKARRQVMPSAEFATGRQQFEEESFFEYHLYTLDRKTTVKNNQTKQIGLLSADDIGVDKSFVYAPRQAYWFSRMGGPDKSTKVGVYLSFANSESNNLGMPLPKGVVRVYKEDRSGALQFIGEDLIDHTPADETIRIKMGEAFDIVGERVQTDFSVLQSGHLYESSYKVSLRNHKDEDVVVSVVELLSGDWEVTRSSHDFEKESSHRIRFDVPVAAKTGAELTYTVRIRF